MSHEPHSKLINCDGPKSLRIRSVEHGITLVMNAMLMGRMFSRMSRCLIGPSPRMIISLLILRNRSTLGATFAVYIVPGVLSGLDEVSVQGRRGYGQ